MCVRNTQSYKYETKRIGTVHEKANKIVVTESFTIRRCHQSGTNPPTHF